MLINRNICVAGYNAIGIGRSKSKETDDEEVEIHAGRDHCDPERTGARDDDGGGLPQARDWTRYLLQQKAKFVGMDVSDARKLKTMETENACLKRHLAESMLDIVVLKDLLGKS